MNCHRKLDQVGVKTSANISRGWKLTNASRRSFSPSCPGTGARLYRPRRTWTERLAQVSCTDDKSLSAFGKQRGRLPGDALALYTLDACALFNGRSRVGRTEMLQRERNDEMSTGQNSYHNSYQERLRKKPCDGALLSSWCFPCCLPGAKKTNACWDRLRGLTQKVQRRSIFCVKSSHGNGAPTVHRLYIPQRSPSCAKCHFGDVTVEATLPTHSTMSCPRRGAKATVKIYVFVALSEDTAAWCFKTPRRLLFFGGSRDMIQSPDNRMPGRRNDNYFGCDGGSPSTGCSE
ncbi:hypothetical protein F2P81_002658 [Scophthalmus maximus]|uniref:Uncharacterized protein n=1 Tax=Scophthalmus maximus TaxID=52904 RepID=A0A6A4TMR3_SCOMX|nr:hypothetical protein F2P81_002658 [Scophthalmus maximus]